MIDIEKVKSESRGKWLGIYESLGIAVPLPPGKHGPCPFCAGSDRFRLDRDASDGTWFCNQCTPQAGDGFSLLEKCLGITFIGAIKKVSEIIGVVEMDDIKPKPVVDPGPALNKLWKASTKLTGSDPVSRYLRSRGLILTPDNIRFCPNCYESDSKTNMPAMVARIQNKAGKPVSLHRTYLNGDNKARIESPKKIMPPTEPLPGAAVRLFTPGGMFEEKTLGIAEGIETAISAAQLFSIATWSVMSTSLMTGFDPPYEYKNIVIFADNDSNFAGQKAAYKLASKLYRKDFLVEVMVPAPGDWNNSLNRQSQKEG